VKRSRGLRGAAGFAVAGAVFAAAFVAVATPVFLRAPASGFVTATPVSAATEPAQIPPSATAFTRLARRFTDESEKRDPLFADSIGIHAYDRGLDDYSSAGQSRRRAWLRSWRRRLAALAATKLSADDTADLHALHDTIDLELFEDATVAPLRTDPTTYTGIIGNAVYSLTGRAYAPLGERMANVAARLALLPAVVAAAEANLTRPTRVATLQAIDENAGNAELYAGLPAQAAALDPDARAALAKALPRALASIRAFSVFLKTALLARSDANPRVGATVYDRELLLADGTTQTRGELVAAARAQFAANRAAMFRLALPYDRRFFPARRSDEARPNAADIVVRRVLDRLANDHPGRNAIFATARRDVEASEAFLREHPVVVLPHPSTLHVLPTPAFMAGFAGASLDPAGPFTPLAGSYYYIDEIPKTWSAGRVASYLRDYNDYEMRILRCTKPCPGTTCNSVTMQTCRRSCGAHSRTARSSKDGPCTWKGRWWTPATAATTRGSNCSSSNGGCVKRRTRSWTPRSTRAISTKASATISSNAALFRSVPKHRPNGIACSFRTSSSHRTSSGSRRSDGPGLPSRLGSGSLPTRQNLTPRSLRWVASSHASSARSCTNTTPRRAEPSPSPGAAGRNFYSL